MLSRAHRGIAAFLLTSVCACSVLTSFDGLVGESTNATDSATDTSIVVTNDGTVIDASTDDALTTDDGSTTLDASPLAPPAMIANAGGVAGASGTAQTSRLVYAAGASKWVLFYITDAAPSAISTRTSSDFSTWTDGPALTLPFPHGGDPRELAVTTTKIGSQDVFHLSISLLDGSGNHVHKHSRATLAGGALSFGVVESVSTVSDTSAQDVPDGPASAITASGAVYDFSGFSSTFPDGGSGTANAYVFLANESDDGGAFSGVPWTQTNIELVTDSCNARAARSLGGENVLALWENGAAEPKPTNVRSSKLSGTWSTPVNIFPVSKSFDANDWTAVVVGAAEAHAVRAPSGVAEHAIFNGTAWAPGGAVPVKALTVGSGVALVQTNSGVTMAGIATTGAVVATTWNGSSWSAWSTIANSVPGRSSISSFSSPTKSAIVWTQKAASVNSIVGLELQ